MLVYGVQIKQGYVLQLHILFQLGDRATIYIKFFEYVVKRIVKDSDSA